MNKADREYADDACGAGCILCELRGLGATPAEFHHPRTGVGAGRKAPDSEGIPLCWPHHRGHIGIHGLGRKLFERTYGYSESELTAMTKRRVASLRAMRLATMTGRAA